MLYAIGQQSELLHFIRRAQERRPGATYPAPTLNTIGRYYLSVDAQDWMVLGSLMTVETLTLANIT